MTVNKHLIRRYLLATAAGVVVGLLGVLARYELFCEHNGHGSNADENYWARHVAFHFPAKNRDAVETYVQQLAFLSFLLCDNSAANIFLCSTLLVPFSVDTFDVVAASRRKRVQGGVACAE
jgi:hypothetical protein